MVTVRTKRLYRVRVGGSECRSAERLVVENVREVRGIEAASLDPETRILTAFVDWLELDEDGLMAAIVDAGLVPEEIEPPEAAAHIGGSHVG